MKRAPSTSVGSSILHSAAATTAVFACLVSATDAAAQVQATGTYEYVSPEGTGMLRLDTGPDDTAHILIETARDDSRCRFLNQGTVQNDVVGFDLVEGGTLTVRLFDNNAEVETAGSTRSICDAGARIGGIYISTSSAVSLDQAHIIATQENLNKLGMPVGPVDGVMGPQTREAMNMFERQQGLPVNRFLTLGTLYHLEDAVEEAVASGAAPGAIPGTEEAAVEEPPRPLQFAGSIPERHIEALEPHYGDLVSPQQIDWNNPPFEIAFADLATGESGEAIAQMDNPDIIVFFNDQQFCEDGQCRLDVMTHDGEGYEPVLETEAETVEIGADLSNGLHDIVIDDANAWRFDGNRYEVSVYQPDPVR